MTDPRGEWGTGVPASAGFMPELQPHLQGDGYVFANTRPASSGVDVSRVSVGRRFSGAVCPACSSGLDAFGHCKPCTGTVKPMAHGQGQAFKLGLKLSRHGAQRTRGAARRRK